MSQPAPLPSTRGAHAILLVDDEAQACKWFARLFGDEFAVLTAASVDEALALMTERGHEVAVVLTDYRMPGRHGVDLLKLMHLLWPHVSRLLVSAYADKDIAMAAVNQGQVERILEKPLDEALTRHVLREALRSARARWRERELLERRTDSLRETLGFLAHEVTTPLATVSGYLSALKQRQEAAGDADGASAMLAMLNAAQRRTDFAQSLVSSFVQTARDASRGERSARLRASDLLQAVHSEYPFENGEASWLRCELDHDFELPGRRDLLFLVLCTLVKNALLALRAAPPAAPRVTLALRRVAPARGLAEQPAIVVSDNGPGIAPHILHKLGRESVTTRAESGGSGMGLVFCQRVMTALGGAVGVASDPGAGARITLCFPFQTNPDRVEDSI